jgi:hypothetical protein
LGLASSVITILVNTIVYPPHLLCKQRKVGAGQAVGLLSK